MRLRIKRAMTWILFDHLVTEIMVTAKLAATQYYSPSPRGRVGVGADLISIAELCLGFGLPCSLELQKPAAISAALCIQRIPRPYLHL